MKPTIRRVFPPIDHECSGALAMLFESCFGKPPDSNFQARLNAKSRLLVTLCELNGKPIGFKIGYEKHPGTFFSWLGGVDHEHRRAGIARGLLRDQHKFCLEAGYAEVQTETFGDVPEMLILNLSEGFEVYGTHLGSDQRIRVQLRKMLKQQ